MSLTRLQLGELYFTKGGVLERKFLGSVLHQSQQILGGGVANPTQAQTAWANYLVGQSFEGHSVEARKAMEWGLDNNSNLQDQGDTMPDGDLDWIVAEYAKTYTAS
jgi:hypothetical protein